MEREFPQNPAMKANIFRKGKDIFCTDKSFPNIEGISNLWLFSVAFPGKLNFLGNFPLIARIL